MFAIDFFSGAGGLTRGLLDAGISVIAGLDANPDCRQTYEANNAPARFIAADIRKVKPGEIRKMIRGVSKKDLLFAACAPCQPFSKQKIQRRNSSAKTLLGSFGDLVAAIKPGHVLIENVPGLAKVRGDSTYRRFLKTLDNAGYKISERILDAKQFGVPQTRRRLVILASRHFEPSLPEATHGRAKRPYVTVRDAIARFPRLSAGRCAKGVPNHRASALSPLNLERLRHTPKNGGDRRSWPRRLRLVCHSDGYSGHTDVYGRMWWGRPAPALTGRCDSLSNGRHGHPRQDRAISLREAAALQSFADDYVFYGRSKKSIALQIGNAVPVALARNLGRHILRLRKAS
jgi:DNA (cytosine-5)-methyltransferase 1